MGQVVWVLTCNVLLFVHKDPPPPVAAFFITAYSSPVNNPTTEKLRRTVGKSKNTPVLGRTIQCAVGKENGSSKSTSKQSKAFPCVGKENDTMASANQSKTSPCIGKLNDPVLLSNKSKTFFGTGKEKRTLLTAKKSKASSEPLCSSESPNKKRKLVYILYSCTVIHKFILKSVVIFSQVFKKVSCLRNGCWNFRRPNLGKVDTQSCLA